MSPVPLRGRIGVVTGAGSAVGRAIAEALAAEGMSLLLIDPAVRDLADSLTSAHGMPCLPANIDVTDPAAVERMVMHVEQHLGAVDVLVNVGADATLLAQALVPPMLARGHGHVIDVVDEASPLVTALTPQLTETRVVAIAVPRESAPSVIGILQDQIR